MQKTLPLITVLAAISCAAVVRAQSSNPLTAPIPPYRYGVDLGMGINQQSGTFTSSCNCPYSTGSGSSFFIAGVGEMHLTRILGLMGRITMNNASLTSTNVIDTLQYFNNIGKGTIDSTRVALNQTATTNLTYLVVTPLVRLDVLRQLFIAAGPSLGFGLGSTLHAVEDVAAAGHTFTDGSTHHEIQNGPVPSFSAIRLSLTAMIGYEIDLTPKLSIVPTAAADFPLTDVASGTTWKITQFQIGGAIRWRVHV